MPTLKIVVGLPGSGKSHLCGQLDRNHFNDLFHPSHRYGPRGIGEVVARITDGHDCLAEDCYFCIPEARAQFAEWMHRVAPEVQIEWSFFENAPVDCLNNILGDQAHGDFEGRIDTFAKLFRRYSIPGGTSVHPVSSHHPRKVKSILEVEKELAEHGIDVQPSLM